MILRHSKLRDTIIKILQPRNFHPTADDIYHLMKGEFPRLSLASVYRNLNQLHQMNLIKKITNNSGKAFYDGILERHYHIQCTECGRIEDIWLNPEQQKHLDFSAAVNRYEITDLQLFLYGTCPDCQ